jgi:zinc protease
LWAGHDIILPPQAKAPAAVPLPPVQRFTLRNGLEVIAVHDDSLPVTTFQLAIKAGKREVPREKVGLAELTAEMLTRGTRSRNAARIAREIEAVGGSLSASASFEATLVSCKSLSKDEKTCLTLLPDILTHPSFPQSEIDLLRRNLHASVRQRLDDAGQLASAHFQSALWGDGHIRGTIMSDRTIDAIGRDDLIAWHKEHLRPNNAILTVAGAFDAKKLQSKLERSIGRWRKGTVPPPPPVELPKVEGIKVRLVDKPGQTQSHIRVGHLGISHRDPSYYATLLVNYTLGGGAFSSRLMKVVRSKEGKTYSASSSFDRNLERGAFVAATFTRTAETVATVRLVRDVIAKLARSGPSDDELRAAKTNIAGRYAMRFESGADVAGALLAAELHDFDDEYVANYPLDVARVSREDAQAAAARLLDPNDLVIVIVGDAAKIEPQLEEAGWAYELVPFTAPISNWEREQASAPKSASADADPAAKLAGRKILDEALAAKGGRKRLEKLASYHWKGDAQLNLPTGPMAATVEKSYSAPDHLRLDMQIGGGQVKITTTLDGKKGWALEDSPRGKHLTDFAAAEMRALRTQLWRDPELVLLRHLEDKATATALEDRSIDGKKVHVVHVVSGDGSREVTLLVDAKSHLLTGMEYSDQGMNATERYGQYKKVGGVQLAHQRSTKGPQVNLKVTIKSFDVGGSIDAKVFARPPDPAP